MKTRQLCFQPAGDPPDRGASQANGGRMLACPRGFTSALNLNNWPTVTTMLVALASTALTGCASSVGIEPVAAPLTLAQSGLDTQALPAATPEFRPDWWRAFGDSTLDELVERALAGNPNLRVVQARLARAQATVGTAKSADGPQVKGQADVTRERFSGTSIYPPPLGGTIRTLGDVQISASWEFDFFGRNRAAIEAAIGIQRATQADLQAARLLLASNVAGAYVELARLSAQREIAERALKQRDDMLTLIHQRVQNGLDTAVELHQGQGALPESRQQIEQFDEQMALARHALSALTAQPPTSCDALAPTLRSVNAVPLPAVIPADLLGRRADISAARWRVEAASSEVKLAKADFYPNINLTAFVGLQSIGLGNLTRSDSKSYAVGPALHLPIFDAGRLRANLGGKTADLDAAVESYNAAVIDGVHDVADQISSSRSIARQQAEQERTHASVESAYDLATQRYRAGLGSYLTVLTAETSVLTQRRLAADLKARALAKQVALIRALGGGYRERSDGLQSTLASNTEQSRN